MKLKPTEIMNTMFFTQDLILEFTNYTKRLDEYFTINERAKDTELYGYYSDLKNNLTLLCSKYKIKLK